MTWLLFVLVAAVVVAAGTRLARYGDVLAEKTGLGRSWIGLVLVAATTSLPELFIGVSAAAVYRLPDIAVGDVLGSCMFNLVILSFVDVVGGRVPLSARAQQGHALSIGFGALLVGLAGSGLLAGGVLPSLGWVGVTTPLLVVGYLVAVRMAFLYERRRSAAEARAVVRRLRYEDWSGRTALLRYTASAVVVVAAAMALPGLGERLARDTGLGETVVGTLFVALASSLPEAVVALSAVRLGAIDLAFGNVLGSNLFNLLILAVDDLFFAGGPLLAAAHESHLAAVLAVEGMYAVLLIGLTYQALRKRLVLAWDSAAILGVYVGTVLLLVALRP